MYVRVAEITSQSSLQFKMLMAFIENELQKHRSWSVKWGNFERQTTHALSFPVSPQKLRQTKLCPL